MTLLRARSFCGNDGKSALEISSESILLSRPFFDDLTLKQTICVDARSSGAFTERQIEYRQETGWDRRLFSSVLDFIPAFDFISTYNVISAKVEIQRSKVLKFG
jgi:hypothetical protein